MDHCKKVCNLEVNAAVELPSKSIYFKAFKLFMSYRNRETLLYPNLWPEGIIVRKFYKPRTNLNLRTNNENSERVQSKLSNNNENNLQIKLNLKTNSECHEHYNLNLKINNDKVCATSIQQPVMKFVLIVLITIFFSLLLNHDSLHYII